MPRRIDARSLGVHDACVVDRRGDGGSSVPLLTSFFFVKHARPQSMNIFRTQMSAYFLTHPSSKQIIGVM